MALFAEALDGDHLGLRFRVGQRLEDAQVDEAVATDLHLSRGAKAWGLGGLGGFRGFRGVKGSLGGLGALGV